jgi:hypothetical protein
MKCNNCGKKASENYSPLVTKYPEGYQVDMRYFLSFFMLIVVFLFIIGIMILSFNLKWYFIDKRIENKLIEYNLIEK